MCECKQLQKNVPKLDCEWKARRFVVHQTFRSCTVYTVNLGLSWGFGAAKASSARIIVTHTDLRTIAVYFVQTHCGEATPRYRHDRSRSFDGKVTICCWQQRDPLHSRPTQEKQSHRRQNWLLLLYKEPPTLYWRFGPRYKSQRWQMGELPGIEALLWLNCQSRCRVGIGGVALAPHIQRGPREPVHGVPATPRPTLRSLPH